jgi:hypothetical protein
VTADVPEPGDDYDLLDVTDDPCDLDGFDADLNDGEDWGWEP